MRSLIGVLALQGAFHLHKNHIEAVGGEYREVINTLDLDQCSALILPGGESSALLKHISERGLISEIKNFAKDKPIWGICAGGILIASQIINPSQKGLDLLNLRIIRNAYGSQLQSFQKRIQNYEVSFIRAPQIDQVGPGIQVTEFHENIPVEVQQKQIMVTTFHPELNKDYPSPWHKKLFSLIP